MTWIIPIAVLAVIFYFLVMAYIRVKADRKAAADHYELDEYEEQTYYHKY